MDPIGNKYLEPTDMTKMLDVMVDIETTGLRPDRNHIIQIAAVRFDFETGEVDSNFFNRCMWPSVPHRAWQESTRTWWMGKNQKVFQDIQKRMEEPQTVMQDFADWAGYQHEEPLRFWGKPVSFDYSFIDSYFHDLGIMNPFHYRYTVDLNSFRRGRKLTSDFVPDEIQFDGDAHNAIFDCLHQIKIAFQTKEL